VAESELDAIREEARQEVMQAVERARAGPRPDPATVLEYVYSAPSIAALTRETA
jgi:TPP-dependent pyruvate/acetoin dehydrogenase alpha subunit